MVWKHLHKIIYQGVQENVILNVTIFVFRQRYLVTSNFLYNYCTFCELNSNIVTVVLQEEKKIFLKNFRKRLMNVIHKFL